MDKRKLINCLCLAAMSLSLSGCLSGYVTNPDFTKSGPLLIKPKPAPIPEPTPEPIPEPEPEPVMSVGEQNTQAMESLGKQGFETEQNEKGVVVYLPPSIFFTGSESKINLDAREKISQIANEINQDYLLNRDIEIAGHTDTSGSEELNMQISKDRALAAAGELVFSKVDRSRLVTSWFGESKPRVNDTQSNGQIDYEKAKRNRRVEFTILNPF